MNEQRTAHEQVDLTSLRGLVAAEPMLSGEARGVDSELVHLGELSVPELDDIAELPDYSKDKLPFERARGSDISGANSLQTLQWRHREIIRQLAIGRRTRDICADMGVSASMVRNVASSPLAQAEIRRICTERDEQATSIAGALADIAPKALRVLEDVLLDETMPAKQRVLVGRDLLSRAGYAPITTNINVSAPIAQGNALALIKQRAFGSSAQQTVAEPVQPVEVALESAQ